MLHQSPLHYSKSIVIWWSGQAADDKKIDAGLPSPIKRIMSSRSCCTKLLYINEIPAHSDRANKYRKILKRTWQSRCRTAIALIFTEILDQLTHYLMYFIDCSACFVKWNVSRNRALRFRYINDPIHRAGRDKAKSKITSKKFANNMATQIAVCTVAVYKEI